MTIKNERKAGRKSKAYRIRNITRVTVSLENQLCKKRQENKNVFTKSSILCDDPKVNEQKNKNALTKSSILCDDPKVNECSKPTSPTKTTLGNIHIIENSPVLKTTEIQNKEVGVNHHHPPVTENEEERSSNGNRLIDIVDMKMMIENEFICKSCKEGTLTLKETTVGIATKICVSCNKCKNKTTINNDRTKYWNKNIPDTADSFTINCSYVLGLQQIGCGSSESNVILTFLNLPHGR